MNRMGTDICEAICKAARFAHRIIAVGPPKRQPAQEGQHRFGTASVILLARERQVSLERQVRVVKEFFQQPGAVVFKGG